MLSHLDSLFVEYNDVTADRNYVQNNKMKCKLELSFKGFGSEETIFTLCSRDASEAQEGVIIIERQSLHMGRRSGGWMHQPNVRL